MSWADIVETLEGLDRPNDDVLATLAQHGVDLDRLWRRWSSGLDIPRLAAVTPIGLDVFEFAGPGDRSINAMVVMVRDELGDAEDIIAWTGSSRPPRRWLGRGVLLGAETAFKPRLQPELTVHPDLTAWFGASCTGVVVLDPVGAAPLLRRAAPLQASTRAHAHELRKITTVPPILIRVVATPALAEAA
jgi:hypothetical protein